MKQRLPWLDILRGFAVFLMILFHLNYSLVHIFWSDILNFSEIFWYSIWKLAAITFILVSWVSFAFAEKKYGKKIYKKYLRYTLILSLFSTIISLWTYFLFPKQFIVFGILHFFALSFLLLPYVTHFLKWFSVFAAFGVIIYGIYFLPILESSYLFPLWFHSLSFSSADYYPLFPWFGVLLLGYSFWVLVQKYNLEWIFLFWNSDRILKKYTIFLGRKALFFYLIHQPIIIFILFFVQRVWWI